MSNGASRGLSQEDAGGDGEQDRYNNEPRSRVWLRPKKPRIAFSILLNIQQDMLVNLI